MSFSPELADIRFGCGLSPKIAPPASAEVLLDGLRMQDSMAVRFPIDSFETYSVGMFRVRQMVRDARKSGTYDQIRKDIRRLRGKMVAQGHRWHAERLLRWAWSETPLRERLTLFWSDHFTTVGKFADMRPAVLPYMQDAIRPNLTGRFGDMVVATTTHPMMLHFLDQSLSVGPNSAVAARAGRLGGLNENLAREVLELHTLGVNGPYTQDDVRQLAELFTGLSFTAKSGFRFRSRFGEPGAETILGKSYGGDTARLAPVTEALQDLAVHPATARHIAGKLAVHFVSDTPDPALVGHVAARFTDTGGDLMAVYAALLEHPAAWAAAEPLNAKPPLDYIASACRALAVDPDHIRKLKLGALRRALVQPLKAMGQTLLTPTGPDGWPEDDSAWITPQSVSARLRWALAGPAVLSPDLPDPRGFVETALGRFASQTVRFAAGAAESRSDAIGLVLAAPAFQRR